MTSMPASRKGASNYFGSAIMAIQSRFGHQHPNSFSFMSVSLAIVQIDPVGPSPLIGLKSFVLEKIVTARFERLDTERIRRRKET